MWCLSSGSNFVFNYWKEETTENFPGGFVLEEKMTNPVEGGLLLLEQKLQPVPVDNKQVSS